MGKLRHQPSATSERTFYQGPPRSHLFRDESPVPPLTAPLVLCDDMSADEYFATGVETSLPYELIEGELTLSPPPNIRHQEIQFNLSLILGNWVKSAKVGRVLTEPVAVRTAADTILLPDIVVISNEQYEAARGGNVLTCPDLVIEIISPHGRRRDRIVKFGLYESAGIPNYWIVDPESRAIEGYELNADGRYVRVHQQEDLTKFSAPPFPELVINLDEVFGQEAE